VKAGKGRAPRNRRADETPSGAVRLAFALGVIAFAFALQFVSADLASLDGYFHIRYASLLREAGWRGFPPTFPWLPLTILSADRYFDHHMLFHVWLEPFAGGNLVLGAKVAAAVGAAAAFLAPYLLLRAQRVRRAEGWIVAMLAAAPAFLFRMEMPRAQSWAVVFLIVALAFAFAERDRWLLPLGWLFAWTYDGFPALLLLAAGAALARTLLTQTIDWRPLGFAVAGVLLGLIINPYFPSSFPFVAHHFAGKLDGADIPVGVEWDPLPIADWIGWGGLVALLIAVGAILYRFRAGLDGKRLTAVLAALGFLVLAWRWSRFLEYFVPMATIALALCLHERVDTAMRGFGPRAQRAVVTVLFVWLAVTSVIAAIQIRDRPPAERHAAASRWIAANSAGNELVFNANWDDFPLLFFHNPHNSYAIGLDPSYLSRRNPDLYELWRRLRAGEEAEPGRRLGEGFGARLAITDRRPLAFIEAMDRDPLVERAYEDEGSIVYRVRSTAPLPTP
jgi:hypothetical protein